MGLTSKEMALSVHVHNKNVLGGKKGFKIKNYAHIHYILVKFKFLGGNYLNYLIAKKVIGTRIFEYETAHKYLHIN